MEIHRPITNGLEKGKEEGEGKKEERRKFARRHLNGRVNGGGIKLFRVHTHNAGRRVVKLVGAKERLESVAFRCRAIMLLLNIRAG